MSSSSPSNSTMTSVRAMYYAHEKHGSQLDPDGRQHYDHVLRVVDMVSPGFHVVAWLHDVVEDTETTLDDLREAGVANSDLEAIDLLTRREGESYGTYIGRIVMGVGEPGVIARSVKEADLLDNLARCLRARNGFADLANRYRRALPRVQMGMFGR